MGLYLHSNKQDFSSIVLLTSNNFNITPAYVIKDYFISLLLKQVSKRNSNLIFKGGTCLSKCHHVINRFSEDIDLGVASKHISQGDKKRIKKSVTESVDALNLKIVNLEETRSGRDYNKYIISIPDYGFSGSQSLILETALMTPVVPNEIKKISCYIYDWFMENNTLNRIADYKSDLVYNMNVSSLERTFCDKVFAICDYYLVNDLGFDRQSRHIYDIYKLLDRISLDNELLALLNNVREDRRSLKRCLSAHENVELSHLLDLIVAKSVYKKDYDNVTRKLLFDNISYDEACSAISKIAYWLKKNAL